ncbi:MAG: TAXI family TRAP transporter solute-binding subunit [Alphaproteobacteria bacterium]
MPRATQNEDSSGALSGRGVLRLAFLFCIAAAVAALAGAFGIARDYGYLHASILSGSPGGQYHALATRLSERARREHGTLTVIPTAGSIENVTRLDADRARCNEMFALIQDGTPVSADMKFELLGRLPLPESLLLLGKPGRDFRTLSDLRGATIGIGPEGSGTAHLMQQLLTDRDLHDLDLKLSFHPLAEQAKLVAQGKLDIAAMVMQEDADFLRKLIRDNGLDIVAPDDLPGLIARHPWLGLGRIPAGLYDLVRHIPAGDRQVARLNTLLVASPCAPRADRIALLMLVAAELPGFVRGNPPSSTSQATALPLAREAHQFFLSGEPELADRYFPWLVNLMSPAYWVYLVMAITILFNLMNAYSRFRLWRIDAARERLETATKELVDPGLTLAQIRAAPESSATAGQIRESGEEIVNQLLALRARCERQTNSIFTPMGDEMYYRYQRSLIEQAIDTLATLIRRPVTPQSLTQNSIFVPAVLRGGER